MKKVLIISFFILTNFFLHADPAKLFFSLNVQISSHATEGRSAVEAALNRVMGAGKYRLENQTLRTQADYAIVLTDYETSHMTTILRNSDELRRTIILDVDSPLYEKAITQIFQFFVRPEPRRAASPVYLEELQLGGISSIDLGPGGNYLAPSALDMDLEGNLLVAVSRGVLVFNSSMALKDFWGKELAESGNFMFSYNMKVSPGGAVYTWPVNPNEFFVKNPHDNQFMKRRLPMGNVLTMDLLPDGSMAGMTMGQQVFKVWRDGVVREFPLGGNFFPNGFGTDQLGRVYFFDALSFSLRVYTPEGSPADIIVLEGGSNIVNQLVEIAPDGSSIFKGLNHLVCFSPQGRADWMIESAQTPTGLNLSGVMGAYSDKKNGLLYLSEIVSRKLVQFKFPGFELTPEERSLVQTRSGGDARVRMTERARLHEAKGALDLAVLTWEELIENYPMDQIARTNLARIRSKMLLNIALIQTAEMNKTLDEIGVESARPVYQRAIGACCA